MPYDGRGISNYIIEKCGIDRPYITNMAVQKILYFAHGWHLAKFGTSLVRGGFEAWEFGPVNRSVYNAFKRFGSRPISSFAEAVDISTGEVFVPKCDIGDDGKHLVDAVVAAYGHIDAIELSRMTHAVGSPWFQVWNKPDGASLGMRIPDDSIRRHFLLSGNLRKN